MPARSLALLLFCLPLAACGSSQPRVVQASKDMPTVQVTSGMATQIEMPNEERVQSVVTGKPDLLAVERAGEVVNLIPKAGSGETNIIVRTVDVYKNPRTYQYRVVVGP